MNQDESPPILAASVPVRRGLKFLTYAGIAAFIVVAALWVVGSAGGGRYIHKNQATSAALFSGGAVTAGESNSVNDVIACGRSTGTIKGISYSTGPFIVHGVQESPKFPADPSASARALSGLPNGCMLRKTASQGVAVQACVVEANSSPGLTQFTVGPWTEAFVICAGESS